MLSAVMLPSIPFEGYGVGVEQTAILGSTKDSRAALRTAMTADHGVGRLDRHRSDKTYQLS